RESRHKCVGIRLTLRPRPWEDEALEWLRPLPSDDCAFLVNTRGGEVLAPEDRPLRALHLVDEHVLGFLVFIDRNHEWRVVREAKNGLDFKRRVRGAGAVEERRAGVAADVERDHVPARTSSHAAVEGGCPCNHLSDTVSTGVP